MSYQKITLNREAKFLELKKNLAWACCSDLLYPPLPPLDALRFSNKDTEEDKQEKREEHRRLVEEREIERVQREPELIREFEKVIDRLRISRREYDISGPNYASLTEAYRTFRIYCERCKNQVRSFP
jgi:hypothetical protein